MSIELDALQAKIAELNQQGRIRETEPLLKQAAERTRLECGDEDPAYAAILNDLGGLYRGLSEYAEAESAFTQAMDILARSLGRDHPDYATTINNLAGLYRLKGEYSKSESFFQEAVSIYAKTLGRDHFLYASGLNNLGLLYQDMRNYEKAADLHREALEIIRSQNENQIAYATSLNNLAGPYRAMGRYEEAEALLKEALVVYGRVLGNGHPLFASGLNNMAALYFASGDYAKAEPLYLQALQICATVFGTEHRDYASAAANLGFVYERMGRDEEAEIYRLQSVEIYRRLFGEAHPAYVHGMEALVKLREKITRQGQAVGPQIESQGGGPSEGPEARAEAPDPENGQRAETDEQEPLKGLELSELYYVKVCSPMIAEKFAPYKDRIAAGLVGDGSECFGFDDEISRDHDWGPSFCLWLMRQDYDTFGGALQNEVAKLPKEFAGIKARQESAWGAGRTGVFAIDQFYKRFIGFDHVPANVLEWRVIPEVNLAAATNGRVFTDPAGEFTAFRNRLKEFYPEDIRLKKIASRCMTMAQSGQYNYLRCIRRREYVAAQWAESQFTDASISMVFLLNREYKPFYKWMHRALKRLPLLGDTLYKLFADLATAHEVESGKNLYQRKTHLMEEVCQHVIQELRRQDLSDSGSDFLLDHGPAVQRRIRDPQIKDINVWVD